MSSYIRYCINWAIKFALISLFLGAFLCISIALAFDVSLSFILHGGSDAAIEAQIWEAANPHQLIITFLSESALKKIPIFRDILSTALSYHNVASNTGANTQLNLFNDLFSTVFQTTLSLVVFKLALLVYALIRRFCNSMMGTENKLALIPGDIVNFLQIAYIGGIILTFLNRFIVRILYENQSPIVAFILLLLIVLILALLSAIFASDKNQLIGQRILNAAGKILLELLLVACIHLSFVSVSVILNSPVYANTIDMATVMIWGILGILGTCILFVLILADPKKN